MHLLDVQHLSIGLKHGKSISNIVKDVSFSIDKGEVFGIVGESGCGKSLTAMSILRLIKEPVVVTNGEIILEGNNLLKLNEREMRAVRGKDVSMIFQEPMTSLHPLMTIGAQIEEALLQHLHLSKKEARDVSIDMLARVGIDSPKKRLYQYPYELSGGMRQRVMIAIALSCESRLLLADEPTTALDVTIQAQILELLRDLSVSRALGVLLITHDMGVISETCKNILVMYWGEVVEKGDAASVLSNPLHPYTEALLRSIPRIGDRKSELFTIEGRVPMPTDNIMGCPFEARCHKKMPSCARIKPSLTSHFGREVRCLLFQ